MNSKKTKKLRRAVDLVCTGQPDTVQNKVWKLVKKNHKLFDSTSGLKITSLKVVSLVKKDYLEKHIAKIKKFGEAGKLASKAGQKARKAMEGLSNVKISRNIKESRTF